MYGCTVIGGSYTLVWNSLALGFMKGDGYPTLLHRYFAKMIDATDIKGRMTLGGFYLGPAVRAMMKCQEYKAGPIAAMWPWGNNGVAGVIGRDLYAVSQALVMTAVAGTPAAATPASRTLSKTILSPEFDVSLIFGPEDRPVPLELLVMPFLNSTDDVFFLDT